MKGIRLIAIALLCLSTPSYAGGDPLLHVRSFIGMLQREGPAVNAPNCCYWSLGTEVSGKGWIKSAGQVASSGVAQADFRLCTYEDGSPILENGKYFFCASSRHAGLSHSVYSIDLNTSSISLVGCIQGTDHDGRVIPISATHIMYDRNDGYWYVVSHLLAPDHVLCLAKCARDPRFGLNEIVPEKLDYEDPVAGDEDNFIFYDRDIDKWVLAYSRKSTFLAKQYSDSLCGPYHMVSTTEGRCRSLTGINVVRIGGRKYFVTGYGLEPGLDAYKVFDYDDLSLVCDLDLDIPTGGFRGWGTILCVPEGMQTKYQLLTFDRINPTGIARWNYGNIYLYEAKERNDGLEYDIVNPGNIILKAGASSKYGPSDLHFVRRFVKRLHFSSEFPLGELDLSGRIFQPLGNPYPVKDSTGTVTGVQVTDGVAVKGHGRYSLLCGSHVPGAEYVIDLSDMCRRETRYLSVGTLEDDSVIVSFTYTGAGIEASAGKDTVTFSKKIDKVRVIISNSNVMLFDAVQ